MTLGPASAMLAFALAAPVAGWAASILPVDGTASGTDRFIIRPVMQGLTSIVGGADVVEFVSKGPGNPFAGIHGPCFGAMELERNRLSGTGYCSFTDGRGEALALRWRALAPVARGYRGTWEVLGGSGWWADTRGSGTYVYLMDPETRRFNTGITGEIRKP